MQEQYLFEYAVIRVVPRVEREEFMNVGVILYCAKLNFLGVLCQLNSDRLRAFCDKIDIDDLEEHLQSFARICKGSADGGPIARLDAPSRFRWLTATRSTILQTSKVHPGLCTNAEETLKRLYVQLVL